MSLSRVISAEAITTRKLTTSTGLIIDLETRTEIHADPSKNIDYLYIANRSAQEPAFRPLYEDLANWINGAHRRSALRFKFDNRMNPRHTIDEMKTYGRLCLGAADEETMCAPGQFLRLHWVLSTTEGPRRGPDIKGHDDSFGWIIANERLR